MYFPLCSSRDGKRVFKQTSKQLFENGFWHTAFQKHPSVPIEMHCKRVLKTLQKMHPGMYMFGVSPKHIVHVS